MLSYKVFMQFIDKDGDAYQMIEKECFKTWVKTRKRPPLNPTESFRRVLTAHVCGLGGRKPFPKLVERSILKSIRKKQIWPCFDGLKVTIGIRGFRKLGYHERNRRIRKNPSISKVRDIQLVDKYDDMMKILAPELIKLKDIKYWIQPVTQ